MCVCVCVCVREREREREEASVGKIECVSTCGSILTYNFLSSCWIDKHRTSYAFLKIVLKTKVAITIKVFRSFYDRVIVKATM